MNSTVENFLTLRYALGALCTIGLYTVLYRENRVFRFFEHLFLGVASGFTLVALWRDSLQGEWWERMVGTMSVHDNVVQLTGRGYWLYAFLVPVGMMGYMVFSRKHNWISRIPIGVIVGLYAGQQFSVWANQYLPQVQASWKPILPTTTAFFKPSLEGMSQDQAKAVAATIYGSTALTNLVTVITLVCVISYFLFSFEVKSKVITSMSTLGRWLLMIGFGAMFGTAVMMRFTLVIDRMYFVWQEFLFQRLLHR